ncbi:MAG: hypothetical protein KGI38_12275 [Thaumarchaeota archaeon]|nr:hypothetical protein [Nitrososphaerota archaeon]
MTAFYVLHGDALTLAVQPNTETSVGTGRMLGSGPKAAKYPTPKTPPLSREPSPTASSGASDGLISGVGHSTRHTRTRNALLRLLLCAEALFMGIGFRGFLIYPHATSTWALDLTLQWASVLLIPILLYVRHLETFEGLPEMASPSPRPEESITVAHGDEGRKELEG